MSHQKHNLKEGLRSGDLREFINPLFTVDQYKSKMGEDSDVVVLGFRVREKHPALDLMEFMEKGYPFILDADISAGEEHDGQYQVFVEIKRSPELPEQMRQLMKGIGQLCSQDNWRFRYQRADHSVEFNEDSVSKTIPLTPDAYKQKVLEFKNADVNNFFDQGSVEVSLDENNTLTFSKPYSGNVNAKLIALGDYESIKDSIPGKISMDESSQSQVLFLTKYLGRYDIDKIGDKFLIRNNDRAMVIEKNRW